MNLNMLLELGNLICAHADLAKFIYKTLDICSQQNNNNRKVRNRNNVTDENSLLTAKETLKQKIQVKAQRLRRYDKRNRFYRQNKIFNTDAKTFSREIGKRTINIEEPPVDEEMTKCWNDIWGKEKDFNNKAE